MRRSWGTPTDGIGTRTTAHLNLTRTLADEHRYKVRRDLQQHREESGREATEFPSRRYFPEIPVRGVIR